MANICLSIGTKTSADNIVKALTTLEGLQGWWTDATSGNPQRDGVLEFRFGGNGGFDMRVIRSDDVHVHWQCVQGPEEWIGTQIEFDIVVGEKQNKLMFRHVGWAVENTFFHHCSTKWATFLLSLRDYVESGQGQPFPNDIKIEAAGM